MKNELVIKVYRTAGTHFKIWRPMAWDMRSVEIVIARYAVHIFRRPSSR